MNKYQKFIEDTNKALTNTIDECILQELLTGQKITQDEFNRIYSKHGGKTMYDIPNP